VLDRLASQSDIVIHLAAAVGVKLIVNHPVETIEINVNGTEAVLKAALHYDCRVVIASTSEVYGKGSRIPFAEDDDVLLGSTMKSRWSYAASKMIDEFLALAYHAEFGLPVTILRLFNTVGPRQRGRYGMVVPRLVAQALAGEPMTVYGTGEQRRCFCDVRDVVEAILGLADHREAIGRVFNIGSTEETTILSLAERVRELADSASSIRRIPYDRAYPPGFEDMQRRVPDTSRIHGLLGWTPRRRLDEILAGVIEAHRGKQPMIGSPPEQMVSRELLSR
jgi:UDP-glucose 4-epimerase